MTADTTAVIGSPRSTVDSIVRVTGLKKVYESNRGPVEAIGDITFDVPRGQFACIVGPSGAGKTTLLKCLAGLLSPTAGEVVLEGERVDGPPRGMAVVFQEYGRSLFPWKTVQQNVELPLRLKKTPRDQREHKVAEALTAVGLADRGHAFPWQLSGGMQQRVAIARAIAYEPHVLLMDEPFAAVDAQTRADLEDLVRSLWQDLGVTTLFVTHDVDEAVYLGERVLVLSASPTCVLDDITVDLPADREQVDTRSSARFAALRTRVHRGIQDAKAGRRTPSEQPA
ncbi:ABC transporter ATP-binding protein [uncultured Modestobacter sp.]|uniref:ABC transporter ATP-binding protein n=1 Tax=uncultured Modestobacter sp. TaxID=380048 RepID=UPI00263618B6|nr:ABC transporter ATP-binding protein [uncultured Modestobacter sp.]